MINEYAAFIFIGMAALIVILFILIIINIVQNHKLKKKYNQFMTGKDGSSLEDNLVKRVNEIEELITSNKENEENIEKIFQNLNSTFQKIGMVKYDAFHEMGGKLSFSLALLNRENDGFIINAMHSREGCYTYIKEIIQGNSVIVLSDEEKEALDMAMK
ncbi:MAG: DUF4446 family protein [Lachnospiraceae bacterium]|nr:DUF4446 family protein [Lachnospiraceae bacterium]